MTTQPEPNDELKKAIADVDHWVNPHNTFHIAPQIRLVLSSASREQKTREVARQLAEVVQACYNGLKLEQKLKEVEKEHDEEIGEFQNKARNLMIKMEPRCNPDGAGCDSGDWRDFTLSEIAQGMAFVIDERDQLKQERDEMREEREQLAVALYKAVSQGPIDHKPDSDYDRCPICQALKLAKRILAEQTNQEKGK